MKLSALLLTTLSAVVLSSCEKSDVQPAADDAMQQSGNDIRPAGDDGPQQQYNCPPCGMG